MLAQDAAIGRWKASDTPNDLEDVITNSVVEVSPSSPFTRTAPHKPPGKAPATAPVSRTGKAAAAVKSRKSHSSSTLPPIASSTSKAASVASGASGGAKKKSASATKSSRPASGTSQSKKKAAGRRTSSAGSKSKKRVPSAGKRGAVAANGRPPRSASAGKTKKGSVRASSARSTSSRKTAASSTTSKKKKKIGAARGAKKRPMSTASSSASKMKSSASKRSTASRRKSSLAGSSVARKRSISSSRGKLGSRKQSVKRGGGSGAAAIATALASTMEREMEERQAMVVEEEMERESYSPVYNVLVMEIVRTQVEQVNRHQKLLNDTFNALKDAGLNVADEESMGMVMERLKAKLHSDAVEEVQQLRAENALLRERLEEKTLELDRKGADVEVLRNNIARKLARAEIDNENLRAEVQRALQGATLDVQRMKKELGHRIDIACSSLRTPKYNTALRSLQDHVMDVQEEIQEHRDTLSKMILSIGAKDTFAKDESGTIHSNLPIKFRAELRNMEKDRLLNIMDVLSFQDGVVDTVGKAIYVLTEMEYRTAVV